MKHLKSYKVFETDFFAADNFDEIKSYLEDIFLDLSDQGFNVEITEPNLKNHYRLQISIVFAPNYEKGDPFKLSEIKDCVERAYEYLEDLDNYFLDEFYAYGPNYKDFRKLDIPNDINEWDLSQELVFAYICFDKNDKNQIQKFNESVSEQSIRDIFLDLTDDDSNFNIDIRRSWEKSEFEVFITRGSFQSRGETREIPGAPVPPGGYPANLFLWFEIKDTIIRLCEYVYSETEFTPGINSKTFNDLRNMGIKYESNAPFRMFNGGTEFGVGWHKEEDFTLGDFISFTSLKIKIKI